MFRGDFNTFIAFWFFFCTLVTVINIIRNFIQKRNWDLQQKIKYFIPLLMFGSLYTIIIFNPVDSKFEEYIFFFLFFVSIGTYKHDFLYSLIQKIKKRMSD